MLRHWLVGDSSEELFDLMKKARDMGLGLISVARTECNREQPGTIQAAELDVCTRCQLGSAMHESPQSKETEVRAK